MNNHKMADLDKGKKKANDLPPHKQSQEEKEKQHKKHGLEKQMNNHKMADLDKGKKKANDLPPKQLKEKEAKHREIHRLEIQKSNRRKKLADMYNLLREQSSRVISARSTDIKKAIDAVAAVNHKVIDTLCNLYSKDDINKDPDLSHIIKDSLTAYYKMTGRFYRHLETHLSNTDKQQTILAMALSHFDSVHGKRSDILQKLESFKAVASKFPDDLNKEFKSLNEDRLKWLHKHDQKMEKLDEKSKRKKIWKKVLKVFSPGITVAVIICCAAFGIPLHVTLISGLLEQMRTIITRLFVDCKDKGPMTEMLRIINIRDADDGGTKMLIKYREQEKIMVLMNDPKKIISRHQNLKGFQKKLKDFSAMVKGIEKKIQRGKKDLKEKMKQMQL